MRCCMWPRNLKNEEAMARVGSQRHGGDQHAIEGVKSHEMLYSWLSVDLPRFEQSRTASQIWVKALSLGHPAQWYVQIWLRIKEEYRRSVNSPQLYVDHSGTEHTRVPLLSWYLELHTYSNISFICGLPFYTGLHHNKLPLFAFSFVPLLTKHADSKSLLYSLQREEFSSSNLCNNVWWLLVQQQYVSSVQASHLLRPT